MHAKLRFSYGTMASGKSLQVLTTAYNFEQRNIHFLIFKSSIDTRDGGDVIKSRIGNGIERECISVAPDFNIFEYIKDYIDKQTNNPKYKKMCSAKNGVYNEKSEDYTSYMEVNTSINNELKWIIVDEAQFLTEEQVDQLSDIVDYLDIDVYCFGLRTDFKTHLFPGSKRLFEIADKIDEIKSTCECGRKNSVNARMTKDGRLAISGAQTCVGGDELYTAICRKCYKDKMKEQENEKEN